MEKYAQMLIDENRHCELAPYLEDESISIQYDVATILFNYYPDLCLKKLKEIDSMRIETGLPERFVRVCGAAHHQLKYGIAKDFQ
jgi:hypothetical protein